MKRKKCQVTRKKELFYYVSSGSNVTRNVHWGVKQASHVQEVHKRQFIQLTDSFSWAKIQRRSSYFKSIKAFWKGQQQKDSKQVLFTTVTEKPWHWKFGAHAWKACRFGSVVVEVDGCKTGSWRVKDFPAVDEEQLGSSGKRPLNLLHRSADPDEVCWSSRCQQSYWEWLTFSLSVGTTV